MSVALNHTIVHARDPRQAAGFLAEMLGLPAPKRFAHFLVVELENGVSLDYLETKEPYDAQHYAFLISAEEFDAAFARIKARGLVYWADPARSRPGQVNTGGGGRRVYFEDPAGHFLEILTAPYGGGAS